jgi:hypothetical protein
MLFQAALDRLSSADGVLKWEQREGGQFHWDDYSTLVGKTWIQDQQPVLRLSGQAVATPAAPESGRTYDRKLSLQLDWTGGSGPGIDHGTLVIASRPTATNGRPLAIPAKCPHENGVGTDACERGTGGDRRRYDSRDDHVPRQLPDDGHRLHGPGDRAIEVKTSVTPTSFPEVEIR